MPEAGALAERKILVKYSNGELFQQSTTSNTEICFFNVKIIPEFNNCFSFQRFQFLPKADKQ